MPETNGSGRLDRIEAMLERMIEHHDAEFDRMAQQFELIAEHHDATVEHHNHEFKQLMT